MVGYTVTIYAASGKVWVMADWEQDGRGTRLVDWYDLEAGRSAQGSLLALTLLVVERQVAVYTHAGQPHVTQVRVDWREEWATAADRRTIAALVAAITGRRGGGLPVLGSG